MKHCSITIVFLLFSQALLAQTPIERIPDFVFYRLNKSPFTKNNIQPGKKVFFVFFDSDCDHCQRAVHEIDLHYKMFNKVAIYLVTLDSPEKIAVFIHRYAPHLANKRNVTILQDLKNEFIVDFNPRKYPSMLLFSAKGNLLMYQDDPENLFQIFKQL
ncbi:MAG TPA: redoxin domain-containing protein [Mucilaginibacter sp.]|jgi:thioredoxin-related protein